MASFDQTVAQAQPDQDVAAESLHDRHALPHLPSKRDFRALVGKGKLKLTLVVLTRDDGQTLRRKAVKLTAKPTTAALRSARR